MWIWILSLSSPLGIFLVHWFLENTWFTHRKPLSRQKMVALIILFTSVSYGGIVAVVMYECPGADLLANVFYVFFTTLNFGHFYFHLFNMSETARRIRILVTRYESEISGREASPANIEDYNAHTMIEARLDRLLSMGSLTRKGDKYFASSGIMLFSSHACRIWRGLFT